MGFSQPNSLAASSFSSCCLKGTDTVCPAAIVREADECHWLIKLVSRISRCLCFRACPIGSSTAFVSSCVVLNDIPSASAHLTWLLPCPIHSNFVVFRASQYNNRQLSGFQPRLTHDSPRRSHTRLHQRIAGFKLLLVLPAPHRPHRSPRTLYSNSNRTFNSRRLGPLNVERR